MTTAARRPRGEYAKTAARRQGIVEAAVEVFSASGFRKGSLRDIAARVGLSQAGLLHHFPSKEHLLEAVLAWRDDRSRERLGTPVPEGIELLRAFMGLIDRDAMTRELTELHVIVTAEGTSADHPIHEYFVRRYRYLNRVAYHVLAQMQARGEVRPDVDCASAARSFLALWDGLQIQWLLNGDEVDIAGELRRYLQSLLTVDL